MEEGEVVLGLAVSPSGDAALPLQPGVRPFDREAVAGLRVAAAQPPLGAAPDLAHGRTGRDRLACATWLRDVRFDLPLAQRLLELAPGVAAVGPELARTDAARGEGVEEREQVAALVLVAGREPDLEREAVGLDR